LEKLITKTESVEWFEVKPRVQTPVLQKKKEKKKTWFCLQGCPILSLSKAQLKGSVWWADFLPLTSYMPGLSVAVVRGRATAERQEALPPIPALPAPARA
jgi:hypothetical protein